MEKGFALCSNRHARLTALFIFLEIVLLTATGNAVESGLTASGSGFFVSEDGYFLTNYHVIKGAERVEIKNDGRNLAARVINVDQANDIAILKAEGSFSFLPLGRPGKVVIGQEVFTIGFPQPQVQGVAPKLTKGSISATSGLRDDPRFFQISIPIQPGNSGGPVVDENGCVVGIVTASLSAVGMLASAGALPQNVNYAVKSSYAAILLEGLVATEEPTLSSAEQRRFLEVAAAAEKAVGLVLIYSEVRSRIAKAPRRPDDIDSGDDSLPRFVEHLRKAVAAHDVDALTGMMTTNFGYRLSPRLEGAGVFTEWDKQGTWRKIDRILAQRFVPHRGFMVAPPEFADERNRYRGYRAGLRRVNGTWKFAYFVDG